MPKRQVHFHQSGYYHIYNRGAGRQSIFRQEKNYLYLLRLLKKVITECQVTVIAYCLLPNHYHWFLRQDGEISAGKVPGRVFGSYSQAFNKAYERTGTLFEGPYKVIAVETDAYLLHLCRYIHLNPVRHGLVASPEAWPYSNYLEWLGQRPGTLIDKQFVQDHFDSPQRYQSFVDSYLMQPSKLPGGLQQYFNDLDVLTFQEAPSFLEGKEGQGRRTP
jgi:REP element-mobilizing transposase RayT